MAAYFYPGSFQHGPHEQFLWEWLRKRGTRCRLSSWLCCHSQSCNYTLKANTDQSWHKQCQICETLFPHRNSDSASCEMLKDISSHDYAMHSLYCACNHISQHYHFLPASFQCGSYGTVQRKFTANQTTQLCFPSSMQHSMEVTVFLVIIYYYFWSYYKCKHLFLE